MNFILVIFLTISMVYAGPLQQNSDKQQQQQQQLQQQLQPQQQQQHIYSTGNINVQDNTAMMSTNVANKNEENSDKDGQYTAAASQILENPSYDPTIYSTFLPADAIQQYVNQYGSPYPSASYFPVPGAYAVQTGYEGYLVPADNSEESTYPTALSYLRGLIPRSMFGWMFRGAIYLLSAIGIILFGGAITTVFCALTPLCTISFAALPFLRLQNTAKIVGKALGAEITPERIQQTAELVQTAIEKFSQMNEPTPKKFK